MRPLTIAFRGNFRPSFSTETHIAAELEGLGHQVIRIQEDEIPWVAVPDLASDADLLWWTCTWHEDLDGGHAALETLRQRGVPSIAHHLDLYLGLDRESLVDIDPFWQSVDRVFTADGDPSHAEEFARRGIEHRWIRPGVYSAETGLGTYRRDLAAPVGFVGSWQRYHREWPYRQQLVRWLRSTYRRQVALHPSGKPIRGQDLNDLYASVKVIVGDSCNPGGITHYWSDRLYETLGRGGFLIFPHIDGIEDEGFEDGVHLRFYEYGDFRGLKSLIDHYTRRDDEREEIRRAGQQFVAERATYRHRVAEILETLDAEGIFFGRSWPAEIRAGTSDVDIHSEVYEEDVYRAEPEIESGDLVVDVGAHIGFFTVWAAQRGADVIAVEPALENRSRLLSNIDTAEVAGRVTVVAAAIGDPADGRAISKIGPEGDPCGSAWTAPADETPGRHPGSVPYLTLDDLAEHYFDGRDVAVLKVDAEGAEWDLLDGASRKTLERIRYITVEWHGPELLHGRDYPDGALGRFAERLAETHHVEILGRPSAGGYLYARRYDP